MVNSLTPILRFALSPFLSIKKMNSLKVTIIQTNLHWENIEKNLKMFSQKISSIKEDTDVIVLPELFSTGFSMKPEILAESMNGKTHEWMKKMASEKKCVITGSIIIKENGKYFNRLIWQKPDGSYEYYDKKHLFRYGNEQEHYSAGNKKLIIEYKGWKICPLICYDLRFPVWSRSSKKENYDLLIYIANWPERRKHPWKILLQARAIENQAFVIGVNRIGEDGNSIIHSGDSAVVNPKGEIISKTEAHKECIETISLSLEDVNNWRKTFPAWMDADNFNLNL